MADKMSRCGTSDIKLFGLSDKTYRLGCQILNLFFIFAKNINLNT